MASIVLIIPLFSRLFWECLSSSTKLFGWQVSHLQNILYCWILQKYSLSHKGTHNFFNLSFCIQIVDKFKVFLKWHLINKRITIHLCYYYARNLYPPRKRGDLRWCVSINLTMTSASHSSKSFSALEILTEHDEQLS